MTGKKKEDKAPTKGKVLVYRNRVEVLLGKDTAWLSLNQMAELFERDKSAVLRHLRNIFNGKELIRNSVVAKTATTASDGNKRIAAALFICFLDRNGILYRNDRSQRIDNNALVALTLMIAVSNPREKEMMIKIILNLLV